MGHWENQVNENIASAIREINGGRIVRCHVNAILKRVADDLNGQKNATNGAFDHRIDQVKNAKRQLENQHAEVNYTFILLSIWETVISLSFIFCNGFFSSFGALDIPAIKLQTKTIWEFNVPSEQIMRRVDEMTQNVALMEKSISDKEAFIALSHTRSKNRGQRPFSEATFDLVEANLYQELTGIRKVIDELKNSLQEVVFFKHWHDSAET